MSLPHGLLLHQQGKLDQAESAYREHLAAEPNDDYAHSRLALCLLEQENRKKEALEEIDIAISLEPEHDYYRAVRSIILSNMNRGKEALEAADVAISLNPDASFNYTAKASALADLMRWADAEVECRQALTLDSDNSFAQNLLANVLRNQGKQVEAEIAVSQLLADDPESAYAHSNAGWDALRRHDHKQAESHFREALRQDPEFEYAREGLLQSFKARSIFYRTYLRYTFFMARFTEGKQWIIIIGLYLAYQIGRRMLKEVSPLAATALVVVWLGFVMWIWLAPGVGNLLVLLDRSARYALKRGEKWQGIFVGGGLFVGLAALAAGFGLHYNSLVVAGFALLCSTVPGSLTFDNPSIKGRFVFGGIFGFVYFAGITSAFFELGNRDMNQISTVTALLATPAIIASVLCTWIGNISALRESRD